MQDSFNETPTEASGSDELPAHLQNIPPDTPVLMYCTGGIRCDIYSSYLRKKVQHTIRLRNNVWAHEHCERPCRSLGDASMTRSL